MNHYRHETARMQLHAHDFVGVLDFSLSCRMNWKSNVISLEAMEQKTLPPPHHSTQMEQSQQSTDRNTLEPDWDGYCDPTASYWEIHSALYKEHTYKRSISSE